MKLAIMQPYFFPYIGYFQLINSVDCFVVYDDVNYIKGGWINRNNILANGEAQRITLPLLGASSNRHINQVKVGDDRGKILKTIRQNYNRAPYFDNVIELLEEILQQPEENLSNYLYFALKKVCAYLGIEVKWILSSMMDKTESLKSQDRVLDICKRLKANQYINLPGGKQLYDHGQFNQQGIDLIFIEPDAVQYKQFNNGFVPNLSIIDLLMFNSAAQIDEMLERCRFV